LSSSFVYWLVTFLFLATFGYGLKVTLRHWSQLPTEGEFRLVLSLASLTLCWLGFLKERYQLRRLAASDEVLGVAGTTAVFVFTALSIALSGVLVSLSMALKR